MASVVGICNRALSKLGALRITALDEDSRNARALNAAYESIRDAELRRHAWNFAIKRAQLAADTATPAFGYGSQFSLPSDCLRPLPDALATDWKVEGRKILTDDAAPLELTYIARVTDPNTFDTQFGEVLAARLALELCEELTQSNSKKVGLQQDYKESLAEARRMNAFENISAEPPEDPWLAARR